MPAASVSDGDVAMTVEAASVGEVVELVAVLVEFDPVSVATDTKLPVCIVVVAGNIGGA